MQKSIVLFVILLSLASCTMVGNRPDVSPQIIPQKEILPKEEGTSTGYITKNFGSGFTLAQTVDQTELTYSGKIIKTWSHTPSQKFPFGRQSPCAIISQKLEPASRDGMMGEKGSSVWDTLSEKDKKACAAEYMMNVEIDSTPNPRFVILQGYAYYGLFDTQTMRTYGDTVNEQPIQENIQNIIFINGHILIATRSNYDASDELLIFSENFEFQKKWVSPYNDGRVSIEKIENMSQTGVTLLLKELNYTTSKESSRKEVVNF